ncbi:MAG: hypothetical protein ACK45F_02270 [bacterium]
MRRWTLVLVLVAALSGCARGGAEPRGEPAVRVALAVLALQRSPVPLRGQQAQRALAILEALRELRPEEREAARSLASQFDALLTASQRQALRAAREQLRERVGGGRRPSPDPQRLAELRRRLLDRAIQVLRGASDRF